LRPLLIPVTILVSVLAGCVTTPAPVSALDGPALATVAPVLGSVEAPSPVAGPSALAVAEAVLDQPVLPTVFPTVEAAVEAAFSAAEQARGRADRERLRLGTIRRVAGGFVWSAPVRSHASVHATRPMRVRLQLGPDDVAVYGVHPRSGRSDLDRLNESVNRHEKQAVDELDPHHRPLYVLTPSRRILRYPEAPDAVEVVSRRASSTRR